MLSAMPPTVIDATSRLRAFRRLMQVASKFYHTNPLIHPATWILAARTYKIYCVPSTNMVSVTSLWVDSRA